jgi:hypothetical protein
MRADDNIHVEFCLDKITEMVDMWTWRVTDYHTRREMDDFGAILLHFFNAILNVTAWTSSTGRIPDEFQFLVFVDTESSVSVRKGSKAFSSSAITVAIADDYTDFLFLPDRHVHHPSTSILRAPF